MINPYWYQQEAIDSIYSYFGSNGGNPLIALPTGTGKSVVIAKFLETALRAWPAQRILMLTHVKELVEQNAKRLKEVWPLAPVGINCAALNKRDVASPILFGTNKSVVNQINKIGFRDLLIIDEAHLLSPNDNSTYQTIIAKLKDENPSLKVIGLTATPYRQGQGMLTDEGGLFTDICYDLTNLKGFNELIEGGFLAPLVPRPTNTELDISNVKSSKGDYVNSQLQDAVDKESVNVSALQELCYYGQDRSSCLIFATGIEHCEHLQSILQSMSVSCAAVHSKLKKRERDEAIRAFKAGELWALITNNVLTTGFDHPPIDLIGMLRPTQSAGLWVQMLGRGTRPSPGTMKTDCLVLDFAKNTPRLGPINDPKIPNRPGKKTGEIPIKICEVCGAYNHTSARECCACASPFTFKTNLVSYSGTEALIKSDEPEIEYFKVDRVNYNLHKKTGSPDSIKVSYICGLRLFNEWVCIEHSGYAGRKAKDWWMQRMGTEPPSTTAEALQYTSRLAAPHKIRVWTNKKFPEVLSYEY